MSMIDLVLLKIDMLHYVQDIRVVSRMGEGLSDHYVILCKVRLVGAWIKRIDVVYVARKIRSEKLKEQLYIEGYARCSESKGGEWDEGRNFEEMWEQVKQVMVEKGAVQ